MTTVFELKSNVRPGAPRRLPPPGQFPATELRALVTAVQAAVRRVDENTLKSEARHESGPAVHPKVLLALLSFCYARQTYGSQAVVAWLRREGSFHQFSPDALPDASALCRFRRENREPLQRCLSETLRLLAEEKVAAGVVTKVSEASLAEEASRRIIMAMFVDSMELEGQPQAGAPVDLCYLFAKGRALAH